MLYGTTIQGKKGSRSQKLVMLFKNLKTKIWKVVVLTKQNIYFWAWEKKRKK